MLINITSRVKEITVESRLLPKNFGLSFVPRQPANISKSKDVRTHIYRVVKLSRLAQ